jgi:hypothetical protein
MSNAAAAANTYYVNEDMGSDDEGARAAMQAAYAIGEDIDVHQHLTTDMFTKPQSVIMDFDLVATPAELDLSPEKATWKLQSHLSKLLKQNLALRNRHMAGEEHLAGNLNRCIPLGLRIIQQKNDFPYFMGIHVPGMMDVNLHKDGQAVWRVPPNTPTMKVKEQAFQPTNIVNQYIYANFRNCTPEDVEHAIQLHPARGKTPAHAQVLVDSLPHQLVKDNLMAGKWATELPYINVGQVLNPPPGQLRVQVTELMGNQIKELLKPEMTAAQEAMVNLDDFVVSFKRADGVTSFKSPKNMNGLLIGASAKDMNTEVVNTAALQKMCTFHIKAEMSFILF